MFDVKINRKELKKYLQTDYNLSNISDEQLDELIETIDVYISHEDLFSEILHDAIKDTFKPHSE